MREKYYKLVACGYIALIAGLVGILAAPTSWRIGILIIAAITIVSVMRGVRGSIAGSHDDAAED